MYRTGFVPQQYVANAIYESNLRRKQSVYRNYQRNVYESIEYNDERFGEIDDESGKIRKFNRYEC